MHEQPNCFSRKCNCYTQQLTCTTFDSIMARINVCLKQWTVIQSWLAENEMPKYIQECLLKVHSKAKPNISTVGWWYKEAETGGTRFHDKLHNSCSSDATMPDNIYQVDELTYRNHCVKTDVVFSILSLKEVWWQLLKSRDTARSLVGATNVGIRMQHAENNHHWNYAPLRFKQWRFSSSVCVCVCVCTCAPTRYVFTCIHETAHVFVPYKTHSRLSKTSEHHVTADIQY